MSLLIACDCVDDCVPDMDMLAFAVPIPSLRRQKLRCPRACCGYCTVQSNMRKEPAFHKLPMHGHGHVIVHSPLPLESTSAFIWSPYRTSSNIVQDVLCYSRSNPGLALRI